MDTILAIIKIALNIFANIAGLFKLFSINKQDSKVKEEDKEESQEVVNVPQEVKSGNIDDLNKELGFIK